MSARFITQLRGQEVEVEMTILSLDPVKFTVEFHRGHQPAGGFTRSELSALCREAVKHEADPVAALSERCPYCGAADDGTCAYPSEGKPGCLLPAHRERMRRMLEELLPKSDEDE